MSASVKGWLDLGLAAHQRGEIEQAVQAYRHALAVEPDHPEALNLLGTGLLQLGDAPDAVPLLEKAARHQRNNPRLLANLAHGYIATNRLAEACEAYRKASRIAPKELHFQLGVATTLAMQGSLIEAEALLKRLSARFPDAAPVWFNFGNVLRDRQARDGAIEAYTRAIELDSNFVDAINNLGSVLQSMQRFSEAEVQYRRCLAIAPDDLRALYNLGSVVMDLGRFGEAEAISRDLVSRAPQAPMGYAILGAALGHQGRLLEARACHTRSVQLEPENPKAVEVYASTLMETGSVAEGLREFSRALALNPHSDAPRQLLGTSLLGCGRLQDGWIEYGRRPAALRFREKYSHFALCRTLPPELDGKAICVLREQGLGDEIFFLRYAAILAARGARVAYRSSEKIAGLLRRVRWLDTVLNEIPELPTADANILVGDLPHALGAAAATDLPLERSPAPSTSLPEVSEHVSVFWPAVPDTIRLEPLPERVEAMRERLAKAGPPPYIGITWRAGTAPEDQNSVTWLLYKQIGLEALAAAVASVDATLIALQRKPAAGELDGFSSAARRPIHDFTDLNEDLEGMLALLTLIDDYVTVSNTNVHLRAAVGKKARVLVPSPAEWRWRQSGRESPWFPGFPIYRQSLQGDWTAALDALAGDLQLNYARRAALQ